MIITRRRLLVFVAALVVSLSGLALFGSRTAVAADSLPKQLSDRAFWQLVTDFSEMEGTFRSENLISNERTFQEVIPELKKRVTPGGVYLGVGPDQNFTYISSLKPRMVFIVDIRRQNMMQHLLYKAIAEMSDALLQLAADAELRVRLGQAGRRRFTDQFRHQTMTRRLREVYSDILAEMNAGSPVLSKK